MRRMMDVSDDAGGLVSRIVRCRVETRRVSGVKLGLQDPGGESGHLLEALLRAAAGAERGGGIFAFATADGIRTILHDDAFGQLLGTGEFTLVVGVDSVTDTRALAELAACASNFPGLTGLALVHDKPVLFHPKLSWFRASDRLSVIVGSGNLTVRGLRENWEAFGVFVLEGKAARDVEDELTAWLGRHVDLLLDPGDERAIARAALNTGRERDLKHARRTTAHETVDSDLEVLVAETPRSGTRPSQVNFSRTFYERFFGAEAGSGRRITLRSVAADGTVGAAESPPSSSRGSRNYSLELSAFRVSPPDTPPVIGVYVKLPQGTFLYQRVAPGEPGYDELAGFLDDRWAGPAREKRRVSASAEQLRAVWPGSPLWSADVPSS
jgi:hypothetical protein